MIPRLKELYKKQIQVDLKNQFGFKNLLMVPKIQKVVLNMGLGVDGNDNKIIKSCEEDLGKITGQKHHTTDKSSLVALTPYFNAWLPDYWLSTTCASSTKSKPSR